MNRSAGLHRAGWLTITSVTVACAGPSLRYVSTSMSSDRACFKPGASDYPVSVLQPSESVADTFSRLTDTAYARAFLDGVVQRWPVPLPLPRQRVTVRTRLVRDGSAADISVDVSSGGPSFDARAVEAVRKAAAERVAGALPRSFRRDTLPLLLHFGPLSREAPVAVVWLSELAPPQPDGENPAPSYPSAYKDGRVGRVTVAATVDTLGSIDPGSVRVLSATDAASAASVLEVLPRWHFAPAVVRGCKIAREVRLPFEIGPRAPT